MLTRTLQEKRIICDQQHIHQYNLSHSHNEKKRLKLSLILVSFRKKLFYVCFCKANQTKANPSPRNWAKTRPYVSKILNTQRSQTVRNIISLQWTCFFVWLDVVSLISLASSSGSIPRFPCCIFHCGLLFTSFRAFYLCLCFLKTPTHLRTDSFQANSYSWGIRGILIWWYFCGAHFGYSIQAVIPFPFVHTHTK